MVLFTFILIFKRFIQIINSLGGNVEIYYYPMIATEDLFNRKIYEPLLFLEYSFTVNRTRYCMTDAMTVTVGVNRV